MGISDWLSANWFDLFQTTGIIAGFLIAAYTTWKDERAREIGNSIAINEQYRAIWKELFRYPQLARVFSPDANAGKQTVSIEEETFVKMLISHLSTVFRAMRRGEFVTLEGLQKDVQEFFTLPIPKAVWEKFRPLQDRKFAAFVEASLHPCMRQRRIPIFEVRTWRIIRSILLRLRSKGVRGRDLQAPSI